MGAWLIEQSSREGEVWSLPAAQVARFGKGKYPVPQRVLEQLRPLLDRPFSSREALEADFEEAVGKDARKYRRLLEALEHSTQQVRELDRQAWDEVASALGLGPEWAERLAGHLQERSGLARVLAQACQGLLSRFYGQIDQQLKLLQSDLWADEEIALREEHIRIKTMLLEGRISEPQWGDPDQAPEGVRGAVWKEFLEAHRRVQYQHMRHPRNLNKSIANDRNFIAFIRAYRDRTRQELAQPYNTDFRLGGPSQREVARQYGKAYDTVFMRMLSWAPSAQGQEAWEIYIPGATLKGAFRKRASQVLKTLWGNSRQTTQVLDRLFGTQGQRGLVLFSDAYLVDPQTPQQAWCSMDGVKMDPRTGQPVEEAKSDFLFAYGERLAFRLSLDLQDLAEQDQEAYSLLLHLLRDFRQGDIPLGGEKTCGFGWVQAQVEQLCWLSAAAEGLGRKLFGQRPLTQEGIWQRLRLEGEEAIRALQPLKPLVAGKGIVFQAPPMAGQGFISHRAFGGYCGTLALEVEVLTPVSVQESGEPSHRAEGGEGPINGWDFFSMSPPEAAQRPSSRVYALPSKSLKGMVRHLYSIASDSRQPSPDLSRLNPADHLFGYVGKGPNQALAGRVSFGFGIFSDPQLGWFKVPYPYGRWQYLSGQWQHRASGQAAVRQIEGHWRLFLHAPLAPCVQRLEEFRPDTAQANYFRAMLPGTRGRFAVRFWNLSEEELQRFMWCLVLEEGLAHKLGHGRYLGFGSVRLRLLPDSFLVEWGGRYANDPQQPGQRPLRAEEWLNPRAIAHWAELRQLLDAGAL